MGAFSTKRFLRNDFIDGQGKEVLVFCKRIHLANNELDRIFHEYKKFEDQSTHKLDVKAMFSRYRAPYTVFERILFQIYDREKSNYLTFLEYLVIVWGFLSCDDETLAHLTFSTFDMDRTDSLDIQEVKYLVSALLNFQFSKHTKAILKKIDGNKDSVMTLPEFVLFCKYHPEVLQPLKNTQTILRKHIVFSRFWRQLTKKRNQYFPKQSILVLRDLWDVNYPQLSMDYLNLQGEDVPNYYIEQWKVTQRKKQHSYSYKGNVELPYEIVHYYEEAEHAAVP